MESESKDYKRAWLRGFFDSEGSAPDPKNRRVKGANTDTWLLSLAKRYLKDIGIPARIQLEFKGDPSPNNKRKPCLAVRVTHQTNLVKFSELVGFSNPEKQAALASIIQSYGKRKSAH